MSAFSEVVESLLRGGRATRYRDLTTAHRRALETLCQRIGFAPLAETDLIAQCPGCGDETLALRPRKRVAACLGCRYQQADPDDLAADLSRPPEPDEPDDPPNAPVRPENVREITRRLARSGLLVEPQG